MDADKRVPINHTKKTTVIPFQYKEVFLSKWIPVSKAINPQARLYGKYVGDKTYGCNESDRTRRMSPPHQQVLEDEFFWNKFYQIIIMFHTALIRMPTLVLSLWLVIFQIPIRLTSASFPPSNNKVNLRLCSTRQNRCITRPYVRMYCWSNVIWRNIGISNGNTWILYSYYTVLLTWRLKLFCCQSFFYCLYQLTKCA